MWTECGSLSECGIFKLKFLLGGQMRCDMEEPDDKGGAYRDVA